MLVYNDCKKFHNDVSTEQETIDKANELIGDNSKILYKDVDEVYVSEDEFKTWRKDYHRCTKPPRDP